MRIKLAWSQTCVLFPFYHCRSTFISREKKAKKQPTYWVSLLAGGRRREAGIDHFQHLFCFGVWLHLSVETHCTMQLRFILVETKQMLRVREACNTRRLFLMSAVKLHPSVPGEIWHIIPFSFPSDEFRDTEWLNQRRQEWVSVRANISVGIFLWAWLSWVTLSRAQYIASA